MSKKAQRIAAIKAHPDEDLAVKQLSTIIGVSPSKIYKDLQSGKFEGCDSSGPGDRSDWIIPKQAAIDYVNSFKDTHKVELLPSHRLKVPGWEWTD
ncbi:MAG: hypothetical protein GY940_09350 [bacterium]|nr:hypothetical protein [bacterium]